MGTERPAGCRASDPLVVGDGLKLDEDESLLAFRRTISGKFAPFTFRSLVYDRVLV